jgi:hypothetical protein
VVTFFRVPFILPKWTVELFINDGLKRGVNMADNKVIPFKKGKGAASGKVPNEASSAGSSLAHGGEFDNMPSGMSGLANEAVDVVRRMLELSDTITEAIGYLVEKLSEGDIAQVAAMLPTIGEGLESLERSLPVILKGDAVPHDVGERCSACLADAAEAFEDAVMSAADGELDELMQRSAGLDAKYRAWHEAICSNLRRLSVM